MLDSMRNLSKSIASKILMGFLVLSFGIWGIGDIFTNSGPSYAAKVGGQVISIGEFQQQRSVVGRQLEALNIKNLPPGQLEISVIRQLVQQKLTLQTMRDIGLFVNDALLKSFILSAPEFADESGKFSTERFKRYIANQQLAEPAFVNQLKQEIAGRFLFDSLAMNDATPPASILALEGRINGETRDAVLLTIPAGSAAVPSDDTALQAFYEENKSALYMLPETRTLEYVVLTQSDIDQLLKKSAATAPEGEAAGSAPARERALLELGNSIEDALAGGKTMGEAFTSAGLSVTPRLLENAKQDAAKTGGDEITRTVIEQGFGLSEGEISRLIRSRDGALLMVSAKKINAAAPKPFDAVKADVATRLGKEQALAAARTKAQAVKAALAKAPNWQAVTEEFKLSNRAVSRLPRPVEGKKLESNGVPLALHQAIFERNVNEVAGPLTNDNGDQVIALITASHLPAADGASTRTANEKDIQKLGQEIENRAFQSFTTKHKVTINPALMRTSPGQQ